MKKGLYFKLDTENLQHALIINFFNKVENRKKTDVLYHLIMRADMEYLDHFIKK